MQQTCAREREQVHHRHVIAKIQAVGTGNRNILLLKCTRHLLDKSTTTLH